MTGFHAHLANYELPPVAEEKAPLPDDPHILTRHIKSLAYFLGADMVGVCACRRPPFIPRTAAASRSTATTNTPSSS
jgi:hypothetical protein